MIINMMQEIVIMMSCRNFRLMSPQDSVELVSGDIVKHAIFGRGRVVKIAPSSDTIHVDFNNVGMKKLALEYANLEKVEGFCR